MDEINAFFDFTKEFKRKAMPRGIISGNAMSLTKPENKVVKKEYFGTDYVKDIVKDEEDKMNQVGMKRERLTSEGEPMSGVEVSDEEDEFDGAAGTSKNDEEIHAKFNFNARFDQNLPIYSSREVILKAIAENPVVVLQGDTGCGKTTQVPQYILQEAFATEKYCNIVVTQPRRIAAISIAKRVSAERKWPDGSLVGYQVGLHASISDDTRLLYCTTGVLLQKLIREKTLDRYTHIILDEVHERDQDMDFLLIIIRRLLTTTSKHVKVILMSATINTDEFADYFKIRNRSAPIIKVDKKRMFDVAEFYLDDLDRINMNNASIDFVKPGIGIPMFSLCVKLIMVIDNIEKHEMERRSKNQNSASSSDRTSASVLVFLPGLMEIETLYKKLVECTESTLTQIKLQLIRLHSLISPDEQCKVFRSAPPGFLKVILATNIAESSITVPDVKYVIDFCLTKVLVSDSTTNFSALELQWASRANCRQRSGRAGRVSNGRVYRLIPKIVYQYDLAEFGEPEMLRCPLENVVLKAKLLDMGNPPSILGLAMNPPNLSDIENTILKLKEIGALYLEHIGEDFSPFDGELTFMGRVMAQMPLDVRLTRLVLLGYIFSVLDDAIIIAAGLSVRSIFKSNTKKIQMEVAAHVQKLSWADNSGSDLLGILRAYNTWVRFRENHITNEKQEQEWADRFFINLRSIKEMHLLVEELRSRLNPFGVRQPPPHERIHWRDRERTVILKIVIAGAFYPNFFTRSCADHIEIERNAFQILSGNDPCNTIYFTNFNSRHIGPLYSQSIKEFFKHILVDPDNIEVRFPPSSERVYVTFKDTEDDDINAYYGSVRNEVSKALYLRLIGMKMNLRLMEHRAAVRYLQENQIGSFEGGVWKPAENPDDNNLDVLLPTLFEKNIRGYITHIDTCSKFYFQPLNEIDRLRQMRKNLDELSSERFKFQRPSEVSKGMIVAAPFEDVYHRAKVLQVITSGREHIEFKVFFIDYGNHDLVNYQDLRQIPPNMKLLSQTPGRCFECCLAHVKPSSSNSAKGKWKEVEEAMEMLQKQADEGINEIEVYSVTFGIVNVILKCGPSSSFNDKLVEIGLARKTDENYMSKCDHDFRLRKQSVAFRFRNKDYEAQVQEYKRSALKTEEIVIPPPPPELCTKTITLKGPFSPLETNLGAAVRVGTWKTVSIERESVNCILLDTDPQDMHERLIVAANVSEGNTVDSLVARSTTLMPSIHGFGALVTMLFCPKLQIKTNKQKTKYSSILAGLGYDPKTMESLHPEHDISMNLDVDLPPNDIELINHIRYCMDGMLYNEIGSESLSTTSRNRIEIAETLKNSLIRLLNKSRKFVEVTPELNDNMWLPETPKQSVDTPALFGKRCIFPMHSVVTLREEDFERIHALTMHCKELHSLRLLDCNIQPTMCKLCNQNLENITQVRLHLLSQLHLDRESQIRFKPEI